MNDVVKELDDGKLSTVTGGQVSWRVLAGCAMAGFFIYFCWHSVMPIRQAWNVVDQSVFFALNGSLALNQVWQYCWVIASSRWFDAIPGLLILYCYATLFRDAPWAQWKFLILQFLVMMLFILFWQDFVADYMTQQRDSPGHVLQPFVNIKDVLPWVPDVKTGSHDSFPGDHASVLVYMSVLFFFLLSRRISLRFILLAPLFCLPRLVAGAHWLSDVAVGGLASGLVGAAVFLGLRNLVLLAQARWR